MVDYDQQTEEPNNPAPTVVEPVVQVANNQPQPQAEQPPAQAQPNLLKKKKTQV